MNSRAHSGYLAFVIHRVSGVTLALFVPVHLFVISLLLEDPNQLDAFLSWTSTPAVKLSESVLILLAAAHLAGGIRIISYEFITETAGRHALVYAGAVFAVACALGFLLLSSI